MKTEPEPTSAPVDRLVGRRVRTKKSTDDPKWLLDRLFEFIDLKKKIRYRAHQLPESLIEAMQRFDRELSDEFHRRLGIR